MIEAKNATDKRDGTKSPGAGQTLAIPQTFPLQQPAGKRNWTMVASGAALVVVGIVLVVYGFYGMNTSEYQFISALAPYGTLNQLPSNILWSSYYNYWAALLGGAAAAVVGVVLLALSGRTKLSG